MSIDFSVQASMPSASQAGAQVANSGESGILLGRAATVVEDPMSLLADAAEEMTFGVDNSKNKELAERKERTALDQSQLLRVQLYQELLHQAGKEEAMNDFKASLRSRSRQQGTALAAVREHFPDPSEAWAALLDALADAEKDPAAPEGLAGELRSALTELEAGEGTAIRAGVNAALEASGYADLANTDTLTGLYRSSVAEFNDVNAVFAYVQKEFGTSSFERAMDFLFATLSADLASDLPSMETKHLELLHGTLGQVRLLQSAFVHCEDMVARWENVHQMQENTLKPMDLLNDLVQCRKERFLGAFQIEEIADKAHAPDIEHEVLFLQDLMQMTQRLPTNFFEDMAGRGKMLDAMQEALDKAVQREDEYLATME
jgi:type III secretion protein W